MGAKTCTEQARQLHLVVFVIHNIRILTDINLTNYVGVRKQTREAIRRDKKGKKD